MICDNLHGYILYKKGDKLIFQRSKDCDKDEYSFGIIMNYGCTFAFASQCYELIEGHIMRLIDNGGSD